jgi:hypothetical protein
VVGIVIAAFMIWCSDYMGRQFEILSESGEKVGEPTKALASKLAAMQSQLEDTSCGFAEEGQLDQELAGGGAGNSLRNGGEGLEVELPPLAAAAAQKNNRSRTTSKDASVEV